MIYKKLGKTGENISLLCLGGHEYLDSGLSRGFNEDPTMAIKPGYIFDGFGQDTRKKILQAAFDVGINFFDVTQDSEKEALGRNLKEVKPPYEIFIQTRPEGMVYTYDPNNTKMADYNLLKNEVHRICQLLQRDHVDFLNFAFMKEALDHDPEYLAKISHNVASLKKEGLIRYACADTFSGQDTYVRQIEAACFDVVYINYNFGDHQPKNKVLPLASQKNMGVITREAFMKGRLFKIADAIGFTDKPTLARAAMKWCLNHEEVSALVYGTGNIKHLLDAVNTVNNLKITDEEQAAIDTIRQTQLFKEFEAEKTREFLG